MLWQEEVIARMKETNDLLQKLVHATTEGLTTSLEFEEQKAERDGDL